MPPVANSESKATAVAAKAAQQLEEILGDIDGGNVSASAAQRAYLAGACQALKQLAGTQRGSADAPPSGAV